MFPLRKGGAPAQAHVGIPEGTFEEEYGRNGFFGRTTTAMRLSIGSFPGLVGVI